MKQQSLTSYNDDNNILVAINDTTQKLVTINFIYCLPFELLSLVFRSFPIQDLFECMKVDALWRYRIRNSPTLWQHITIADDNDTMLIPKLSSIGSYIKSYKIIDGSEKAHRSSMNLITTGYLNRLQSLVIHEAGYYFHSSINNIKNSDLLLQSIQCLQNTLTELELSWYKRENNSMTMTTAATPNHLPQLSSLLTACPGLKRLWIDMPAFRKIDNDNDHDNTHVSSPLLLSTGDCWQLTHLHWSVGSSRKISAVEIESILTACPSLTYFKLDPCTDSLPLLSIFQKCSSSLRFLGLNAEHHSDIYEMYWNDVSRDNNSSNYIHNEHYSGDGEDRNTTKLEAIVIPCLNRTDWNNLINFIMINQQQQSNTLQDLTILHHDNFDIFNLTQLLQVYRGKQIRLRHTGQRKQYVSTVEARVELISAFPSSSLISTFVPHSNKNYYEKNHCQQQQQQQYRHQVTITSTFCRDYMTQCPWFINQLKDINDELLSMELISLVKNTNITTTALVFTQCFILDSCLHHLLEGGFSCLQELYIENCVLESTTLTDLILGLVRASASKDIKNKCKAEKEKEEQVDKLRPSLSRLSSPSSSISRPCMKHISFGSIPGLTDDLVATLADIPSLKQVTLTCCYSVTDQGVRDLVDKSSIELEQVTIHDCKQVSYVTTEYIQRKLSSRTHYHHDDHDSIVLKRA